MNVIPKSLRTWFLIHFWVDLLIAIPLFLFPSHILSILNVQADLIFPRIIAAAMFAIGTTSLLTKNAGKESYVSLLTLKIIWSSTALFALALALLTTRNLFLVPLFLTFLVFNIAWVYFKRKL